MLGYGYLLLQGANLLSDGSELLLEVLSPGLIGGLVLPVLGALPDALVIVVSGLGASAGEAQEQVMLRSPLVAVYHDPSLPARHLESLHQIQSNICCCSMTDLCPECN